MSRSVKGRWGRYKRIQGEQYADEETKRELLKEALDRTWLHQRVRVSVRRTEAQAPFEPPPVDPQQVIIRVLVESDLVHHPATEEDLREVLRRLPGGLTDGLGEIHLGLPDPYEEKLRNWSLFDPYLGLPCREVFPGVHAPLLRGQYSGDRRRVRLMGVIHPPGAAPEAAVYLKLRVLHTFLHELSHHYDHTFRLHGDRWRKDDKRKVEGYAERRSHHLVRDVVVPYLRERYPAEHEAFQEWLVRHGGGRIDLSDLADEDGAESPAQALIIDLVDDLREGRDPVAIRTDFARGLVVKLGDAVEAQRAVDSVLAERPDDLDALAVRGRIEVATSREAEAETTLRGVLAREPDDLFAREALVRALTRTQQWPLVIDEATRLLETIDPEWYAAAMTRFRRGVAELVLSRWKDLESDAAALAASKWTRARAQAEALIALGLCFRGRYEEALSEARRILARPPRLCWLLSELRVARFECARRLGRPAEAGSVSADDILESRLFFAPWIDRLVNELDLRPRR